MLARISLPLVKILAALLFLTASSVHAAEPTVTARLSSNSTQLGNPVKLSITVEGSRKIDDVPAPEIDGLRIQFAGRSQQFQMINFKTSVTVLLNYIVTPMRTGSYTIPAQTVRVNDEEFATRPLSLTVSDLDAAIPQSGAQSSAPDASSQPTALKDLAWAELIVPKSSAYVGEPIPVVIRAFFDSRVAFRVSDHPQFAEKGFTMKQGPEPRQERKNLNGREYTVVTYNLAVTPVKDGTMRLGPAELQGLLEIPIQSQQRRSRSMIDDFFDNPFGRVQRQEITMTTDPVELEIKSLPVEGRPTNFKGTVGRFEMSASSDAKRVNIGDPITVSVEISGRGDFDRVQPPSLSDPRDWRTYPPTSDFTPDDTLGLSGTKTFQLMIIPDANHSAIPPLSFSYFDPTVETYKTLQSDPIPITVEGNQRPSAPVSPTAAGSTPDSSPLNNPAPNAATVDEPETTGTRDILHIHTGPAHWSQKSAFTPLHRKAYFWWWQLAPLLGAVGLAGWLIQLRRNADQERIRRAAQRAEKDIHWQQLNAHPDNAETFLTAAVHWLQLNAAQHSGHTSSPAVLGSDEVIATLDLSPVERETVQSVFSRHDELRYAGNSRNGDSLPDGFTQQVLATFNNLNRHE